MADLQPQLEEASDWKGRSNDGPVASMLLSTDYSDMTFIGNDGEAIPAHCVVVCAASPVIMAECDGPFKEGKTKTIKVEEFDTTTIKRVLSFIYVGSYGCGGDRLRRLRGCPAKIKDNERYADVVLVHIEVYGIADYYNIEGLKKKAEVNIIYCLPYWSPINFSNVIQAAYRRFPLNDRWIVQHFVDSGVEHMTDLASHTDFKDLMAENTDYAVAFCTVMVEKVKDLDTQLSAAKEAVHTPKKRKAPRVDVSLTAIEC